MVAATDALERAQQAMTAAGRRSAVREGGHLAVAGARAATAAGLAPGLMRTRLLPVVYERWWRPLWGQLAKGVTGPGMGDEHAIAIELLGLGAGDTVLDLACGPGNFSRSFAAVVGEDGLVIGVDASPTMLERAVADTTARNVAYLRADASELPLRNGSVDAVCCFAALNLFSDPWRALDEIARVLRVGGSVALFTSCRRGPAPLAALARPLGAVAGMTLFGRAELADALRERGFDELDQRVSGVTQFLGARRARSRARASGARRA